MTEEAADVEQQHGDRIGQPVLLASLVDAADPVEAGFDRAQHRREEGTLAIEDACHVASRAASAAARTTAQYRAI